MLVVLLLTAAGAPTIAAPPPIPANAPIKTYIVQPGDSAWSIAEAFYGRGDYYPIIYKYNDFDAKGPFLLTPGQTLRLPLLQGGPEAHVGWLHRDVRARPPRSIDWLEARERMNLWRLYRVATGDASAARIVFEDTSDLKMREKALLVIYGASATTARIDTGEARRIEVEAGTVVAGLAALEGGKPPAAPIEVRTPSGQVGILGLAIQVQVDAAVTAVSAMVGEATVSAQNETVKVPESHGTVVEKGRRPEPPVPLPAGPTWRDDAAASAIVVIEPDRAGKGGKGAWQAEWAPVATADAYRVELAADPDFKRLVYDVIISAGVEGLRLEALDPGIWWVRVASRTARGLEGRPGAARRIAVIPLESPRVPVKDASGIHRATGFTRLELPESLHATHGLVISDGPQAAPNDAPRTAIDLFRAGRHTVAIEAKDDPQARATWEVEIDAVAATFEGLPSRWPAPGEAPAEVGLKTHDMHGIPIILPGLALTTTMGEAPALTSGDAAGHYRFALPPAAVPVDGVGFRVSWAGGILAETRIDAPSAPLATARPAGDLAPLPGTWKRGAQTPLHRDPNESRIGVQAGLALRTENDDHLDLTIAGQWIVDGTALALDAAFVTQELAWGGPLADVGPSSRGGDLLLGARYGFQFDDVRLTPFLRAVLGVGSGHDPRQLGAEGGLLVRWRPTATLTLDVAQALLGVHLLPERGQSAGHEWRATTSLAGMWRFTEFMDVQLSWQLLAPFAANSGRTDRSGSVWQMVGIGWGVDAGRGFRIGAAIGVGVGADTRRELGALSGRLTLDFAPGHKTP
jgi:hypothetical protein